MMFLTCVALFSSITIAAAADKTILVFGGTGNMGTEVVNTLLKAGYSPTLVSRGNWQFDSATLIKPRVSHITCDRYAETKNALQDCGKLMELIDSTPLFDIVIDFSAYIPDVVEQAIEVLRDKVGLYIYISSDSVYEVSKPGEGPSKESDAVRPDDPHEQLRLNNEDNYGHEKLQVEEALVKQRESGGFPYLFLRLPDVVGPRDTTQRWWPLQLWIKYYHHIKRPIVLDHGLENLATSLVYTKDVAAAIYRAIEAGQLVHDKVYNLGFDDTFTYTSIVKDIAKELKISGVRFDPNYSGQQFYPSVRRGPVDTNKIKQELGFEPSEWKKVVKDIVEWYERAHYEYPEYYKHIIDILVQQIVPDENVQPFLQALNSDSHHEL